MDIRKMSIDELELLSFTDIAYYIIKVDKSPKTTVELFKEICYLLKLSDAEYEEKIADFFTSLTTDKRFVLIQSINWDLKENHSTQSVDYDSEDDTDDIDEDIDDVDLEDSTTSDYDNDEKDIDDIDEDADEDMDGLEDLEIIEEDSELEE